MRRSIGRPPQRSRRVAVLLRARGKPIELPVPPSYVAAFVAHEALGDRATSRPPRAIATMERHLRGISAMHRDDGHDDPTKHPSVRNALRGARKRLRNQPVGRKSALKLEDLEQMLKRIPNPNAGRRDRALLLLGLAGALRRSELVALQGEDITHTGEGILVRIGCQCVVAIRDPRGAVDADRRWCLRASSAAAPATCTKSWGELGPDGSAAAARRLCAG